MIDIQLFRNKPEVIKESEKKRFKDPSLVDKVIELDNKWRSVLKQVEQLKNKRNLVSKEIADLKKNGKMKEAEKKIEEMKKINEEIEKKDEEAKKYLEERDAYRYKIGNILHPSVPVGKDEDSNLLLKCWGKAAVNKNDVENFKKYTNCKMSFHTIDFQPKSHVDLIEQFDLADTKKAGELVGARFYYLKNELVSLNLGLLKFALDFLLKQGFTPLWTPFVLQRKAMAGAAELADFENQLYKIEGEDLFLIATAEQTIASYHMNEIFNEKDLPKAYVGISTNFRKEAGAHGKDTKGIFRVHQFEKVEQFVFCKPNESEEWFNTLISNAEKIYQKLELPYRVISICSGEMNDNASIKYDLEVWMPAQGKFREVVSCSNCTDYQARKLGIRYMKKDGETEVVHTLNSTALATERTICAILENYQQKDGSVKIPKVLIPYVGFKEIRRK
ncbi:MAG: serine--tRNA ligase [Candidatus Aenigmatarchaeota archaeon]